MLEIFEYLNSNTSENFIRIGENISLLDDLLSTIWKRLMNVEENYELTTRNNNICDYLNNDSSHRRHFSNVPMWKITNYD